MENQATTARDTCEQLAADSQKMWWLMRLRKEQTGATKDKGITLASRRNSWSCQWAFADWL